MSSSSGVCVCVCVCATLERNWFGLTYSFLSSLFFFIKGLFSSVTMYRHQDKICMHSHIYIYIYIYRYVFNR